VTNWRATLNFILINLAENQSFRGILLATSCEILVASTKFLVALATRKAQVWTLNMSERQLYL